MERIDRAGRCRRVSILPVLLAVLGVFASAQDTRSGTESSRFRSDIKEYLKSGGRIGPRDLRHEKLAEYLEHPDPSVVVAVADIIAWRAASNKGEYYGAAPISFARHTVPALSRRLGDKDAAVVRACVKAIGDHRNSGALAFDAIVPLLAHETDDVAVAAAAALRQIAGDWDPWSSAARTAALLPLTRRGSDARAAILTSVMAIYLSDADCFKALVACLSDHEANVRRLAANRLSCVAGRLRDHALEIESAFLRESDSAVQVALLRLIEAMSIDSHALRKRIVELTAGTNSEAAHAAWLCLMSVPGLPDDVFASLRHWLGPDFRIPSESTRPIDPRLVPRFLSRIAVPRGGVENLNDLLCLAKRAGATLDSVQSALLSRLGATGTADLLFAETAASLENYCERDAVFANRLGEVLAALPPKRQVDAARLLRYLGAHARPLAASAWETWKTVSKDQGFDLWRGSIPTMETERFDLLAVLLAASPEARPPLDELIATYDGTRLEARSELLRILVPIGPSDRRIIDRLEVAIRSKHAELSLWAVALAERLEPRELGDAFLSDALDHENQEVRAASARRLARRGYRSGRLADVLLEAIEKRDQTYFALVPEELSFIAVDGGSLARAERLIRAVLSRHQAQPAAAVGLAIEASQTIGIAAGEEERWRAVLSGHPNPAAWREVVCRLSVVESERSRVVDACLSRLTMGDMSSASVALDLLNRHARRSTTVRAAVLEFAEDVYRAGSLPLGYDWTVDLADRLGIATELAPWLAEPAPPGFDGVRLEAIRNAAANGRVMELRRSLWSASPKVRARVVVDPLLASGFATFGLHDHRLGSLKGPASQTLDDFAISFGSRPYLWRGSVFVCFHVRCTVTADGEISADAQAIFDAPHLYFGPCGSLTISEARLAVSPVDRRVGGTLWAYLEVETEIGRFTTLGRALLDPAMGESPATKPAK